MNKSHATILGVSMVLAATVLGVCLKLSSASAQPSVKDGGRPSETTDLQRPSEATDLQLRGRFQMYHVPIYQDGPSTGKIVGEFVFILDSKTGRVARRQGDGSWIQEVNPIETREK
jgi:hypothetical protein